jgi:hypothetical protein
MSDDGTRAADFDQRTTTARHEAGHVVAALHHGTPFRDVSIEREWPVLGGLSLGISKPTDAIAIFCGPLAERPWTEFRPGARINVVTVGTDEEALRYLELTQEEGNALLGEAISFLSRKEVQEEVERVAAALLEHGTLASDDVRAIVAAGPAVQEGAGDNG